MEIGSIGDLNMGRFIELFKVGLIGAVLVFFIIIFA